MDDWKKFSETVLPEKGDFYSHLNMEDITDADYVHAKRFCKVYKFQIKKFRGLLWFICSKQYIFVRWCTWKLLKYVASNIWAWSCPFSFSTKISIISSLKKKQK